MTIEALIIDSREPAWVQQLRFGGIPVTVAPLEAGDLLVVTHDGEVLLIERKRADDLLNTIRAERFLPQLARMVSQTRWCYLVIIGTLLSSSDGMCITDRGLTGWAWPAVQGALLTAQELGVFVVHVAGDGDFEAEVLRLSSRRRDPAVVVAAPKFPQELGTGEQIVASLPGIGPERAAQLIRWCGNPAQALAALTDMTVRQIPGIGEITKLKVRQALGIEPWAELAVISTGGKLALSPDEIEVLCGNAHSGSQINPALITPESKET